MITLTLTVNPVFITPKSSSLLTTVLAKVMAHGGPEEQADDCTQLLVRYNG